MSEQLVPSPRASNVDRAIWRSNCREKLSAHINTTLGLSIEPAQVRLITASDDLYAWKVLPGKEHLFRKQLSKHSIGAYMELFREVGCSFEAVLANGTTTTLDGTFTTMIQNLERENQGLTEELLRARAMAEQAKSDLDHLRVAIETLKQQDSQKMALIEFYKGITLRSLEEASSAFQNFMSCHLTGNGTQICRSE